MESTTLLPDLAVGAPQSAPIGSAEAQWAPERYGELLQTDPQRYAQMVRNISSCGIYLIGDDGLIASWNRGAAQLTGYSESEVVGQPYDKLFPASTSKDGLPGRTLNYARENRYCREEQRRKRRGHTDFHALCAIDVLRNTKGELSGYVEVFHDISEQKQREELLLQRATRDALTGIANRGYFTEVASNEIARARRFAEPLSVIMLDIDHFKKINDSYGHETGDRAIIAVAQTCSQAMRKIDLVGRLGGEEFAILLPRADKEPALEIAQRLRMKLSEQRVIASDGSEISFTVSGGVAALRPLTRDLHELLRNADNALYQAKREGRNQIRAWFE